MTAHVKPLFPAESVETTAEAGLGALSTQKGNLPLESVDIRASIVGLAAGITVIEGFHNPFDVPLEATYVFPLPDHAAVTAMRMEAAGRVVEGTLQERTQARAQYETAIAEGRRAAIAEEDRPDVFTLRVGNIEPGERVTVTLRLSQPLPHEDGAATFRFPLVVAPRYIPGAPLDDPDPAAGDGIAADTDAVPDASRISPPILLPGFPNPVRLALSVDIDPAGLPLTELRSSYSGADTEIVSTAGLSGRTTVRLRPGRRLNRDFILRLGFAAQEATSLSLTPDASGAEGTFTLTVMPTGQGRPRPRDVVLLLDRSGSMGGWKIVAARRAAARIVDTLTGTDRFAVLSFDHVVERPAGLPEALVQATDRNRFRAVEHLAALQARGGTEMLVPLQTAAALVGDSDRDRVLVLITDGQVGNEDQILAHLEPMLGGVRVHAVGIDRAVNAGFLRRLATIGQGRLELVESEDRLDEAMEHIHHRISAPLVTKLALEAEGLQIMPDTVVPSRLGALFPGVPLRISGRWRGKPAGALAVRGVAADGKPWRAGATATVTDEPVAGSIWARARLRELEDRYVTGGSESLEKLIIDTSLKFGVLCRFTAFVAVDTRVTTTGGPPHRVIQPVEVPDGWALCPPAGPVPPLPGIPAAAPGRFMPMTAPAPASTASAEALRGMRPRRTAPRRRRGHPRPATSSGRRHPDVLDAARRQIRQEAELLNGSATAPDDLRWQLLSDLRTRLDALVADLRDSGAAEDALTALVSLVTRLEATDEAVHKSDLQDFWDQAVRVLTEFAEFTEGVAGETPAVRRAFWKRR